MEKAKIATEIRSELEKILTERELDLLEFRFGFMDGSTHTLEECGQRYNVTRERVSQIEVKILRKLRRHPDILDKLPFLKT